MVSRSQRDQVTGHSYESPDEAGSKQIKMESGMPWKGLGLHASISSLVNSRTPAFSSDGARAGGSGRQPLTKCPVFSAGTVAVLLCWAEMLESGRAQVEGDPSVLFLA